MGGLSQKIGSEKSDQSIFQCGICQQRYRRADHLARHTRTHSHHKPHQCHLCGKSFSRSDLLKRHVSGHTGPDGKLKGLPRNGSQPTSRVGQACRTCSTNHLRCTDSKPCKRCQTKGIECVWEQSSSVQGIPSRLHEDNDLVMQGNDSNALNMEQPQIEGYEQTIHEGTHLSPETVYQDRTLAPQLPGSSTLGYGVKTYLEPFSNRGTNTATGSLPPLTNTSDPTPSGMFAIQVDDTRVPDWNFLPGQWPSSAEAGSGFDPFFPLMGLDDGDMRFMDVYNQSIPFELSTGLSVNSVEASADLPQNTSPCHIPASGHEAFRHHHWRFRPDASRDHTSADEHNLSLPQADCDGSSPEARLPPNPRITAAALSVATRDSMVALVVKHCRSENLSRIFASFPSTELLDKLCQYYLTSRIARPDTFLHVPSFDPKEKSPELLLAIVAAGAVLTSDPTLMKFGYAMHEIIRHAVAARWESNNALTRNIELLQAFLIHLEVGLWSGYSRKIEITESFLQAPVTILRRSGKFKKSEYPPLPPLSQSMAPEEVRRLWQSWLEHELWKRLALRVLRHDTNTSTCFMVNPIISYAEISLPLPCISGLWTAPSAEAWARIQLQSASNSTRVSEQLSIIDLMDDPGLFGGHSSQTPQFDTIIASNTFLSCAWALAWEYIQLRTISKSKPRRWSSLILSSRQGEIIKLLQNFRVSIENHGTESDDTHLRLEHVMLHIHAPLDEIQVFAGMEGPEQAQGSHRIIKEWADSETGRRALCHAGSIIRLIRKIPRGLVNGPLAFIMFHASLVLWAYSLIHSEDISTLASPGGQSSAVVWLDDEVETFAMQRFVQLGIGNPSIRGIGEPSPDGPASTSLKDPQKLLGGLANALSRSHQDLPLSNLVDKIMSLLKALQASS